MARTANRFYRDVPGDLVLLVIDPVLLRAEVRYEDVPGAELPFPHLYGPLNVDAVIAARPFAPGPDGIFAFTPARDCGAVTGPGRLTGSRRAAAVRSHTADICHWPGSPACTASKRHAGRACNSGIRTVTPPGPAVGPAD